MTRLVAARGEEGRPTVCSKRFHLARVEALVDIDVLSDAQRDESPEDAAARSKEEARKVSDRERQAAMRAEQKAKGNTHYNICAKDTEEAKTWLRCMVPISVSATWP